LPIFRILILIFLIVADNSESQETQSSESESIEDSENEAPNYVKRGLKQGFNPWAGKRSIPTFGNKKYWSLDDLKKFVEQRQRRKPWGGNENN